MEKEKERVIGKIKPPLWMIGIIALGFLITGCAGTKTGGQVVNLELPLLDTAKPAAVETASFALG